MNRKLNVLSLLAGFALIAMLTPSEVAAQCSGGGGSRGGMSSGSLNALSTSNPIASSAFVSNNPSSVGLLARQYQQQVALAQNQMYVRAYQNAQRQRLAMMAYEERARSNRFARAEATRAARAARAAERIAQRDAAEEMMGSNPQYLFASTTSN